MRKRIIPCLFLKNGLIIRSESFSVHQIIGNPVTELKRFSEWAVDEIIYIDLSTSPVYDLRRDEHKVKLPKDKFELLSEIAKSCFVPLGFGGGVRTLRDIEKILHCGADKVVLNTVLLEKPALLIEAAHILDPRHLLLVWITVGGLFFIVTAQSIQGSGFLIGAPGWKNRELAK
jgi:cyclase